MQRIVLLLFFSVGLAVVAGPVAASADLAKQREYYNLASQALKKGHMRTYANLSKKLVDYPLYSYLEYEFLRKRMSRMPDKKITEFIEQYSDSPVSSRMRYLWLHHLARGGRWDTYAAQYADGGGFKLRCYQARALFKVGRIEEAMDMADRLWLTGNSQPSACDSVFDAWEARGGMTEEMIWGRIELAMERGRSSLAKFLSKKLSEDDEKWVIRWNQMYRHPADNLLRSVFHSEKPIAKKIVRHGIKRLARRDAAAAYDAWQQYRPLQNNDTDREEMQEVDRYVAIQAGFQQNPKATEWLSKVQAPTQAVREWRIRSALSQEDWWTALTWIEALPAEERNDEAWQYWRARILEMQSLSLPVLRTAAERIYSDLAQERSYHGFLSADRLGREYQLNSASLEFSDEELAKVQTLPGVARARELYLLGLQGDARREWLYAISDMDEKNLQVASVLAHQWGWHDRAIMTVAKSDHFDDLGLRFPTAFKDVVQKEARSQDVDPAWVYGVLRQESGFMADARSPAGALGLMQLMPATGRLTARELKTRLRSNRDLLDVDKNIRLGTAYLKQMLDKNEGHSALATASYNAGPYRVQKWMPEKALPSDLWVESIPYSETRTYVRRVMVYTVIYDYLLDGKRLSLRDRMPIINPVNG